ncbi:hypothetical protein E2320_019132, partial [Naja naja]
EDIIGGESSNYIVSLFLKWKEMLQASNLEPSNQEDVIGGEESSNYIVSLFLKWKEMLQASNLEPSNQ